MAPSGSTGEGADGDSLHECMARKCVAGTGFVMDPCQYVYNMDTFFMG